jgi:SanA protein
MPLPSSNAESPRSRRRLTLWLLLAALTPPALGLLLGLATNGLVLASGSPAILQHPTQIPPGSVGLVLGTSPQLRSQTANPFFEGRMDTAAHLYHLGAVYHLLLSGDNRRADYNEPHAMRDALLARGVPAKAITLDYAGFRTLDSVIRAHRVFGLKAPLIITDDFHLPRALFIARAEGLNAHGFATPPVPWKRSSRTRLREWGSRLRACYDIFWAKTQPRFLGKTIPLPEPPIPNAASSSPLPTPPALPTPPDSTPASPPPASKP